MNVYLLTSAVGYVCSKPNLLVIWDLVTANNRRAVSDWYSLSNIQVICVTKYVGLQQVWETIWEGMGLMSTPMTGLLLPLLYTHSLSNHMHTLSLSHHTHTLIFLSTPLSLSHTCSLSLITHAFSLSLSHKHFFSHLHTHTLSL